MQDSTTNDVDMDAIPQDEGANTRNLVGPASVV